ncbi:FGL2-like protein, partial [Mya arenaria]
IRNAEICLLNHLEKCRSGLSKSVVIISIGIRMIWLRSYIVVVALMITTCGADRLARLERQMKLVKGFQSFVELRLDALEGDFGTLTKRVSNLESLVTSFDNDTGDAESGSSRTGNTEAKLHTEPELNDIKNALTMYKHSFEKHKKELIDVNYAVNDTLSAFLSNASKTVDTLVNTVSDHIRNSTDNISASLEKNVYATRVHVKNETVQQEKKVEELIGRANEVVGIIDEQRSTIEDGIMVTIRGLHITWSDWSAWSDCSKSCDKGRRSRHRSCYVPPTFTDGICNGDDTETEECVIHEFCSYLSEWSPWSRCSRTCNNGTMTRNRTCHTPASLTATCQENITESQTCLTSLECPVDGQWSLWSTWSNCSVFCGDGVVTRNRSCSNPSPLNGGRVCPGQDILTKPCNLRPCIKYDCSDVLKLGLSRGSGVYRITLWNTDKEVDVYCDMDTDGGGWTVFQRRLDGSVDFNRRFVEYEQGFGSLDGEFWMGLGLLHSVTSRANMTLRMDVSLPNGTTGFDEYSGFYISPPDQYNFNVDRRINSAGMSGSYLLSDIGDDRDFNHQPFSTYDRDVDKWLSGNCARNYGGGWWYNYCTYSNLNAQYNSGGFYYYSFQRYTTLKTSAIMLRLSN